VYDYLVQNKYGFDGITEWEIGIQLKAIYVNKEKQKFGALDVFEKSVAHSYIVPGSLYQTRQICHCYLSTIVVIHPGKSGFYCGD
jgi:hypothetical protein